MKKFLAILLTLALTLTLAGALSGCEKEQKPLRVLIDIPADYAYLHYDDAAFTQDTLKNFLGNLQLFVKGFPEDVEFEILPEDEAERKSRLTRLRTEIMAGAGPDLFIATSLDYAESLFLMPEKSMELGLFYPLDDFIENAQYMEWDKLNQTVMAAGYSEEYGQVLLPLAYTFPVTIFLKHDLAEAPEGSTWQDVIEDDTGILQVASADRYMGEGIGGTVAESMGPLADYTNRKLLFTEEDLLERMYEYIEIEQKHYTDEFDDLPDFFKGDITVLWEQNNRYVKRTAEGIGTDEYGDYIHAVEDWSPNWSSKVDVTMIPAYNDIGGITATVTAFGAINATSKRADDAFLLLDYLLSKEGQRSSLFAQQLQDCVGVPVYEGLMTEENPVASVDGEWYLSEENYAQFCALREQISCVRVGGLLDTELAMVTGLCTSSAVWGFTQHGAVEEIVHQYYTTMRQELSE